MQGHHNDQDRPDSHHDFGLQQDLVEIQRRMARRRLALGGIGALGTFATSAGMAALGLLGAAGRARAQNNPATCSVVPSETAGPFPANGSGRSWGTVPNALALSGIVRSDIRSSIAGATGLAQGVPLDITLEVVDAGSTCAPLAGAAVYLWQCDREGRYSLYSPGVTNQNYLRGVQVADSAGRVRFTTVFPGCYPGRVPHLHFEVYRNLQATASAAARLKTSQLAFEPVLCEQLYAQAPGYTESQGPNKNITLQSDGIFRDGVDQQLLALLGSVTTGLRGTLRVGVKG